MTLLDLILQIAPQLPDSVPSAAQASAEISSVTFDEFLARAIAGITKLAINIVVAVVVFYLGKFIINKLYRAVRAVMIRRKADSSLTTFTLSFVRIVLYFILIVTVIGILGVETSSFLAIFASAGVAVGMALSGTLQNFAGGVLILLLKPYKVDEYIEAQGYAGTVKEIQIFHTLILTPDNKSIIIPNGGLSTGSINNWSREPYRRVDWTIGISYGDDTEKAIAALTAIVGNNAMVKAAAEAKTDLPAPSAVVANLADSAVEIKIRAWVKTSDYWPVFHAVLQEIYETYRQPNDTINFPYPHLDVTVSQQS